MMTVKKILHGQTTAEDVFFLITSLIFELERGIDEFAEKRMRMIRARLQFGVELAADKPRVQILAQLDNLNQAVIG